MNRYLYQLSSLWLAATLLVGCQAMKRLGEEIAANEASDVYQSYGPVEVLKGKPSFRFGPDKAVVTKIKQAGYESRGSSNIVKFRHTSGLLAEVSYFVEVTDSTIGIGKFQYRKSGDVRGLIYVDGQVVGECSYRKSVADFSTLTYGQPHAKNDGEEVVVGDVEIGPMSLKVVSRCKNIDGQGRISSFINGKKKERWHEYRVDNRVVAKRTLQAQFSTTFSTEFSRDLSPVEQICIAADMNYRLGQEREAAAAANTIYVPVPAPR